MNHYQNIRRILSNLDIVLMSQTAKFMEPTWGPPGSCPPQMGPMNAPWTLLSGVFCIDVVISSTPMVSFTHVALLHWDNRTLSQFQWSNVVGYHDDLMKWKHFLRYWPLCERNPLVTSGFPSHRPVMQSFDVSVDLRLNGWANNRDAGDLRRHRAHHHVIIMLLNSVIT